MELTIRPIDDYAAQRMVNYRNHAEELRTIADEMLMPSEKETLRRIADTYDDMANTLSRMRKFNARLP